MVLRGVLRVRRVTGGGLRHSRGGGWICLSVTEVCHVQTFVENDHGKKGGKNHSFCPIPSQSFCGVGVVENETGLWDNQSSLHLSSDMSVMEHNILKVKST